MKTVFLCSLCHNGIWGGALYLANQALTYRTGKLTVSEEYRSLTLPVSEIQEITWKWRIFPLAVFCMKDGRTHRFLIFRKGAFCKAYREWCQGEVTP